MQTQREELSQRVLEAVAQLPQLEVLMLEYSFAGCSLAPLIALAATLRELEFHLPYSWSRFSAADVRALPLLRRMAAHAPTGSDLLREALRMPHGLQWQSLGLLTLLDDGVASLLSRLPTQTSLTAMDVRCTSFVFLQQLSSLRTLDLCLYFTRAEAVASLLAVAAAGSLAQLTELRLEMCNSSTEEMGALLSHLPQLAALTLSGTPYVKSLLCLSTRALSASLRRLSIQGLPRWQLPASELAHLHSLRRLEELRLQQGVIKRTAAERGPYEESPSPLLPRLRIFECQ